MTPHWLTPIPTARAGVIEIRPENADDLANLLDAEAYKAELAKL